MKLETSEIRTIFILILLFHVLCFKIYSLYALPVSTELLLSFKFPREIGWATALSLCFGALVKTTFSFSALLQMYILGRI